MRKKEFGKFQNNISHTISKPTENIKKAVTEWVNYKIIRESELDKRNYLFNLKKKYHNPVGTIKNKKDWKRVSKSGTLSIALQKNDEIILRGNPAQMNFLNTLDGSFWTDRLEGFSVSIAAQKNKVNISRFSLIDLSANQPSNTVGHSFSRDIYFGYEIYNLAKGGFGSYWSARFGHGRSYHIFENAIISIVPLLESGLKKRGSRHFSIGFGAVARLFIRLNRYIRLRSEWNKFIIYKNTPIIEGKKIQLVFWNTNYFSISAYYENRTMLQQDWKQDLPRYILQLFLLRAGCKFLKNLTSGSFSILFLSCSKF